MDYREFDVGTGLVELAKSRFIGMPVRFGMEERL